MELEDLERCPLPSGKRYHISAWCMRVGREEMRSAWKGRAKQAVAGSCASETVPDLQHPCQLLRIEAHQPKEPIPGPAATEGVL